MENTSDVTSISDADVVRTLVDSKRVGFGAPETPLEVSDLFRMSNDRIEAKSPKKNKVHLQQQNIIDIILF